MVRVGESNNKTERRFLLVNRYNEIHDTTTRVKSIVIIIVIIIITMHRRI